MKINKILLLTILFTCSCSNSNISSSINSTSNSVSSSASTSNSVQSTSSSSINNQITFEDLSTKLLGKIGQNEVLNSSKVEFLEVDKRGDSRATIYKETMDIYNDYTSVANGSVETTYLTNGEETKKSDKYQRVATAIMYDTIPVFYLVTDYEDGTLSTSWQDSADRLPIVENGDENYDGVNFLLASSLPGQTTKQVSLITYNFIAANLLGNPDLQASMPYASYDIKNSVETYKLDNFSYSYNEDDSSTVKVDIGFEIKVKDDLIINSSTLYRSTTTRNDEVYVEEITASYVVSYDERIASTSNTTMLNVEDYFLYAVYSVQAYFYNDDGDKEIAILTNLPLEKYIRFEAVSYLPSKAIDIEMYAVESSNTDVVALSGNVFETIASGEAKLTLESSTGVRFEVDVRVNIPEISTIKYNDSSSDIERDGSKRYIYTSTTYNNGIYVTVNPSSAYLDDIEISVSDENVLTVEAKKVGRNLDLTLIVHETSNESNTVTITFTSKTNQDISTTITYNIKQRLSNEEMVNKLLSHTYKWKNIYASSQYGLMTFSSDSTGKVDYYDGEEYLGTTTFTYSIKNTSFNINALEGSLFGYNSGEITLDGNTITARVNVTDYVHKYEILEN